MVLAVLEEGRRVLEESFNKFSDPWRGCGTAGICGKLTVDTAEGRKGRREERAIWAIFLFPPRERRDRPTTWAEEEEEGAI